MLQSLLHLIVMRKGNEVCYQQRRYGGQQHVSEELLVPQQITKETTHHPRKHHSQIHDAGSKGVV